MKLVREEEGLGDALAPAVMRPVAGRPVPLGGVLTPAGPLRRCQLLELPRRTAAGGGRDGARTDAGTARRSGPRPGSMLRLRVRGDAMKDDGIRDGDYLVLDARLGTLRDGQTVLADEAGCTVVRKVKRDAHGAIRLEAAGKALPLFAHGRSERIHGAIVGILRKELRKGLNDRPRRREGNRVDRRPDLPSLVPVERMQALQRSLHSLRFTYRTTRHPRLRRALRAEAALLAREMARERERLGAEVVLNLN